MSESKIVGCYAVLTVECAECETQKNVKVLPTDTKSYFGRCDSCGAGLFVPSENIEKALRGEFS